MPWPVRQHPDLAEIRPAARAWAAEMGMLAFVWDGHRYDSTDFGLFVALTHPDVPAPGIHLVAHWIIWGTYLDDYFVEKYKLPAKPVQARLFVERLALFLPAGEAPTPIPLNPVERGLVDLWPRTTSTMDSAARAVLARQVLGFAGGNLWELANRVHQRAPDPVDFVEMRRQTIGRGQAAAIAGAAGGVLLPPEIRRSRPIQLLDAIAADAPALFNDIVSHRIETEYEREISNGVVVVQAFLRCDRDRAMAVLGDLVTARLRQFEHIVATELPVLFDDLALDAAGQQQVVRYLDGLRAWIAGWHAWHLRTGRFDQRNLPGPRRLLRGPAGLGTAAARLRQALPDPLIGGRS
ncbi:MULTISPECIES: hypothetical protein [unclassified Crossiella]|uniref:terpene synthase family protein n=1 Tax=unclassified Crossiella TaxID=2620835 RepID=UPI001FFECFFD|nr:MULTISPECIES: hypothetical protein [unclassified Crossiella]MCK2244395.1 hypothetical protein [Crossiella sp. S99.2]MCK2257777.1 hypothetical protein [Crossiella sp. S99.1]